MKKTVLTLLLIIGVSFLVIGCGDYEPSQPASHDKTGRKLKVL